MTDHPTHPAAAVWPMLDEPDLRRLADDITAHGLLEPVVLWTDDEGTTWLLDGRNRLAACQVAGVEPAFTTYEGDDPVAYVLSRNEQRRHMATGARAMATALTLAADGKRDGGRWARGSVPTDNGRSSDSAWSKAVRTAGFVLDHRPDLATQVIAGVVSLNDASEQARQRKAEAESAEARLAQLRDEAPDLATEVTEERLTLAEGLAALNARREDDRLSAVAVAGVLRSLRNIGRLSLDDDLPRVLGAARDRGLLDVTLADLDAALRTIELVRRELAS